MRGVWPPDEGGGLGEAFSEGDPCPGELIQDQYRLVTYSADLAIATSPQLPGLDLAGLDFLELADPEEYRRVDRLARRRSEAQRKGEKLILGSPDWIILDLDSLDPAREEEILAELGLTLDQAKALVLEEEA